MPSFPLGHLVLVIRSVRIDGAHEVRPTMPSSAAYNRSVPVRVTERVVVRRSGVSLEGICWTLKR